MKITLKLFLFLIIIPITLASPAAAWTWETHTDIADECYYSLPSDVQQKLSLDAMRIGSNEPDTRFFDFNYHHYPSSHAKATYWLDKGKYSYENGNYNYASYCFGVASHYISDSFCAPHCVNTGTFFYHSLYEIEASFLTPQINDPYRSFNPKRDNVLLEGNNSWNSWMKNRDDFYIQNDLNKAVSASYSAIRKCIS